MPRNETTFGTLRLSDIHLHLHIAIDAIMFFSHDIWSPALCTLLYKLDDESHEWYSQMSRCRTLLFLCILDSYFCYCKCSLVVRMT